jgi:hypothetical protein
MEGASSVDDSTSAEGICKGDAPIADLFFMPEGTGPQRENAEGISEGDVADPFVTPEGAGPQDDNAPSEVAGSIVTPEGAGPQGDNAPLKAGRSTSGETSAGNGAVETPGLASWTVPELLAPAEAPSEGSPLPKRRIARARDSRLMFFHAAGLMSGGRVVVTAR